VDKRKKICDHRSGENNKKSIWKRQGKKSIKENKKIRIMTQTKKK